MARTASLPDTDSDAHGDPNPTLANGLALRQCGTTKQGYVAINDDCCDSDANAHPGQTAYFKTARTGCGGFDYNCINGEEKDPATSVGKLPGTGVRLAAHSAVGIASTLDRFHIEVTDWSAKQRQSGPGRKRYGLAPSISSTRNRSSGCGCTGSDPCASLSVAACGQWSCPA
jgi:hypothetical protein